MTQERETDRVDVDAFPLAWPVGWARKAKHQRRGSGYQVTFAKARDEVLRSLKLMQVSTRDRVISTNIPLRLDGLPYANWREPDDSGVAVYWTERVRTYRGDGDWVTTATPRVIACDHWTTVRENLRGIGLTLEALRAIKRAGASEIIERAYGGFAALPENAGGAIVTYARAWWVVLDVAPTATKHLIELAFREQLKTKHPDRGGTHEEFLELNAAREAALREARP